MDSSTRLALSGGLLLLALGGVPLAHGQSPLSPGATLPTIDQPLQRVDGGTVPVKGLTGAKGTVFLFWSNRCPWADKYESRVQSLVSTFADRGVQFVRVNAGEAATEKSEVPEASRARAKKRGYAAPYVLDSGARLARALGATRVPHTFVFDANNRLVYVGAIDDSPGDPGRVETPHLRNALEAMLEGRAPPEPKTRAFGCRLQYPE